MSGRLVACGEKMIEWLASKIGVLIAIGVTTGFVLGLFAWQHSAMVDREGQELADSISDTLDSFGALGAATVVCIDYGGEAGELPAEIDGDGYSVNISGTSVTVRAGNRMWASEFTCPVIPQNLSQREFNLTEYSDLAKVWIGQEHASGEGFTVERARLEVSGKEVYVTLVYWG